MSRWIAIAMFVMSGFATVAPAHADPRGAAKRTVFTHYSGLRDGVERKLKALRLASYVTDPKGTNGSHVPQHWVDAQQALDLVLTTNVVGKNATQTPRGIAELLYAKLGPKALTISQELADHADQLHQPGEYDHYRGPVHHNLALVKQIHAARTGATP